MSNKHDAQELERQADAILAAAEVEETPSEPAPPRVMTDEEAKKAGIIRLDDKQVAALPAASWLINNEKLRELLAGLFSTSDAPVEEAWAVLVV